MKIVDQVIDSVNEMVAKPASAANLKSGDNVIYKKEHKNGGMMGSVVMVRGDKVDLKLGKATMIDVPVSDLMYVDAKYAFHVGTPSADVPAAEANPAAVI